MRFASLSLERYGRFEDCVLEFREGTPDLHIVYGANEAGKTTSLAAISDLLFGFPARSPYNFRFDYALLRVGATLEDGDRRLACRRKRGKSGTLVDADERPLDEGLLLAMLRGQTRETFGLSFSLNQEGLRAGGRAMVTARDDAGRALFAAGSGLTSVSEALAGLEAEADGIWGARAAQRRSFTQAQRELADHLRTAREQALKPKTWLDAKAALVVAQTALDTAQERRDQLLGEVRRVDRIRRIAPSVRVRAERVEALAAYAHTIDILPQRATEAEGSIAAFGAATQAKAIAERLADEAGQRIGGVITDALVLDHADRIDTLVSAAGGIEKAERDRIRLQAESERVASEIARLRAEVGDLGATPPTRIAGARLRELASAHAAAAAVCGELSEGEAEVMRKVDRLPAVPAPSDDAGDREALVLAVDAARALGADADDRCEDAAKKAKRADALAAQALLRLAPWTGTADALLVLPRLAPAELEEARKALADLAGEAGREADRASRGQDEAARLQLQIDQLASGTAVSSDDIGTARDERTARWAPLRAHILSAAPLPSAGDAVDAFEAAVGHADTRSDLRFAAAEESGRLAIMSQSRAALLLEAGQAAVRSTAADQRRADARSAWAERLKMLGYPDLDPVQAQGWIADRGAAEEAIAAAAQAGLDVAAARKRRDGARAGLAACLGSQIGLPDGQALAPLLAIGDRIVRRQAEAAQKAVQDRLLRERLVEEGAALERRRVRASADMQALVDEWSALCRSAGINLQIGGASALLDLLEDLRSTMSEQAELQRRIDGIARDARLHAADVAATAQAVGGETGEGHVPALGALRSRLAAARAAAEVLSALRQTANARRDEAANAEARRQAALEALAPLMAETHATDMVGLVAALERSRTARANRQAIADADDDIRRNGDGLGLAELIASLDDVDLDQLAGRAETLGAELAECNAAVSAAAAAQGEASRAFASLEAAGGSVADAASGAELARSELAVLAEQFILKRAQAVTLRWAIEQYRERHQDPLLRRASALFATLTLGRYAALKIDNDAQQPRLLGLRDDGHTVVEVDAMSEGTTDQLFLALRLAAVEQSIAAGIRLPFLADDLFVNFDDERSEAGFRVLADLARSTQVLFFTHHPHLASIARAVVGADVHSECVLG